MSPEDPVASELSALKQRVDQIYSSVATQNRGSGYNATDLIKLMALVEEYVVEGVITESPLNNLVTEIPRSALTNGCTR